MRTSLLTLAEKIAAHRFRHVGEPELRDAIADLLTRDGIRFEREVPIGAGSRLDFYVPDAAVAIEVKTRGGRSELVRQVMRYAENPKIRGVLVVTTRLQHYLPPMMAGKPVCVVTLPRGLL